MAITRKVPTPVTAKPTSGGRALAVSPLRAQLRQQLTLSTELSEPSKNLLDYSLMLYGLKKIGKTSMAARFKGAGFFMFEPGGKALRIHQHPVYSWLEFLVYLDLLEEHPEMFPTVVLDTIDVAYTMCFRYVCERDGFTHPADVKYGKGWDAIKNEFNDALYRLCHDLKRSVVFISHAKEIEVESGEMDDAGFVTGGERINRVIPSVSGAAGEILKAYVDTLAYYGYFGTTRRLVIEGNEYINAGTRCEENFLTPTGERLASIPMGNSPDEAYANFCKAFANEQTDTGTSYNPIPTITKDVNVKFKK